MSNKILSKISEQKKNKLKKLWGLILAIIPIISLIFAISANNIASKANNLSESANKTSEEALFYSRLEQPLTYTYDFSFDGNNLQDFDNYEIPSVACKLNISTGAPTRVAVFNCENGIENMYDYNSKLGAELLNDITAEFSLPFAAVFEYESIKYQYIYIYVEGVDSTWNLDCIVLQYDPKTNESSISILDELDVLRLNFEKNEVTIMILNEYQKLFNNIAKIKDTG